MRHRWQGAGALGRRARCQRRRSQRIELRRQGEDGVDDGGVRVRHAAAGSRDARRRSSSPGAIPSGNRVAPLRPDRLLDRCSDHAASISPARRRRVSAQAPDARLHSWPPSDSLEAALPLARASRLSDETIARAILTLSEGLIGEIVGIVTRAATEAVRSGVEQITEASIEALAHVPLSRRRGSPQREGHRQVNEFGVGTRLSYSDADCP